MLQETTSNRNAYLWTFLAGAALGAVAVALTTPKTGPQVREDLKGLGRRTKAKVSDFGDKLTNLWDHSKDRSEQAIADLKHDLHQAAGDLRS